MSASFSTSRLLVSARAQSKIIDVGRAARVAHSRERVLLVGPGANTTVHIGRDGIRRSANGDGSALLQRSGACRTSRSGSSWTAIDADHISGMKLAKSGGYSPEIRGRQPSPEPRRAVFAHENLLNRLSQSGASPASLPTDTYFIKQKTCSSAASVRLHCPPHTDGDTIVFFRRSDVISTRRCVHADRYPMIDLARGGSVRMLARINYILELAVPDINEEADDDRPVMAACATSRTSATIATW